MPTWQPNWNDVAFDHGAAVAAADACERAAAALTAIEEGLLDVAQFRRAAWEGRHRDSALSELVTIVSQLLSLRTALRGLADGIQSARQAALDDQRLRVDLREMWLRASAVEMDARRRFPDSQASPR